MPSDSIQEVFLKLAEEMPPILWRNHPRFKELTGYDPRTMANKDALKVGPKIRVRIGNLVGYPRESIMAFLSERAQLL